jgi:hypothetical protein
MDSENNLTREEILKVHNRRRINIITNIILIIVILGISFYVIYNIEIIKSANQNWCSLCELKTGARCIAKIIP